MHVQSMKAKHELQLVNTVKQLLEKQGEYEKNFHKQNEKFETQQTLINTLSSKLEDVEKKDVEFVGKVENLGRRFDADEKKYVEFVGKFEILGGRLDAVEKKDVELVGKVDILGRRLNEVEKKDVELVGRFAILEKIENSKKEDIAKLKQDIENQLKDYKDKIEALTLFSNDLSRLHLTLGHEYLRRNLQQYFIFYEGEYSESQSLNEYVRNEVNKWNDFTKEIKERDGKFDEYEFLKNIKFAINQYSDYVYPKKQENRYALSLLNKFNDLRWNNLKIQCLFDADYISLKVCNTLNMINNEIKTKKYIRHNSNLASYYDGDVDCLYVALYRISTIKCVLLIHPKDENKNMIVPQDGTKIDIRNERFNTQSYYLFYFQF